MDAVAAAQADAILVLDRASLQRGQQAVEIGQQDVAGLGQLHRQAGVQHIRRRHALVHEARLLADVFGEIGEKGDDVVFGLTLDLVDPCHLEGAALPDRLGRFFGNDAKLRLGVAGMSLDLEPDAELVLRFPDGGHFGAAVTRNHRGPVLKQSGPREGPRQGREKRARRRRGEDRFIALGRGYSKPIARKLVWPARPITR